MYHNSTNHSKGTAHLTHRQMNQLGIDVTMCAYISITPQPFWAREKTENRKDENYLEILQPKLQHRSRQSV